MVVLPCAVIGVDSQRFVARFQISHPIAKISCPAKLAMNPLRSLENAPCTGFAQSLRRGDRTNVTEQASKRFLQREIFTPAAPVLSMAIFDEVMDRIPPQFSLQNPFSESFKPLRRNLFSFELSVLVIDFSRPNNSAQIGWAYLAAFGHRQSASFLSCVHVRIGDLPGFSRRSLSVSFRYRSFAPRFPSAFSRNNSPWHSASLTCRIRCNQRHRSSSRDHWRHSNRGQVRRCAAAWRGGRDSPAIGPHHRPAR